MVTNINLVSPESENKPKLTGKTALALSVSLLVVSVGIYFALSLISNRYARQKTEIESQIQQVNAKIGGAEFSDVADFQVRLDALKKIINDHIRLDLFLRDFSKYVLPEIRLSRFSWDYEKNSLAISGTAPNFDVLTREVVLLKSSSLIQSVEFKGASGLGEAGQGGLNFNLDAKIIKEKYNK